MSAVRVDADLHEWKSMTDVSDEGLWYYQLGQDQEQVYVAIRVVDPMLQRAAARNGILFGILAEKKNKSDLQLLFPYPDREVKRAMQQEDIASSKIYKQQLIDRSRGYLLSGFPTVPDGLLSLQNGYGLKAAVKVEDDALIYEAVVPKGLLMPSAGEITIKLGINDGFSVLQQKQTRASTTYGAYRTSRSTPEKSKTTSVVLLETTLN